jgi:cytochrome b pre-mRNA-processing protein 3
MISALKKIFAPQPYQQEAHQLYVTLVEQARAPLFYSEYQVPDTIDGRFDMIVLHVCLLCKRLRDIDSDASIELSRALMETFFADMDRSLREMGSTDTGVGKRIKKMSQAYFGRLQAYDDAWGNTTALKDALKRNLYRNAEVSNSSLDTLTSYTIHRTEQFGTLSMDLLAAGKLTH